jgi:hypothetical protein
MTYRPAAWWNLIWCCLVHHVVWKRNILDVLKQSGDDEVCNCDSGSEVDVSESDGSVFHLRL